MEKPVDMDALSLLVIARQRDQECNGEVSMAASLPPPLACAIHG
jgi:hypothetical protein